MTEQCFAYSIKNNFFGKKSNFINCILLSHSSVYYSLSFFLFSPQGIYRAMQRLVAALAFPRSWKMEEQQRNKRNRSRDRKTVQMRINFVVSSLLDIKNFLSALKILGQWGWKLPFLDHSSIFHPYLFMYLILLQTCFFWIIVIDSSNAVLGMAFNPPPPPRKGDSLLYCRDKLCTA